MKRCLCRPACCSWFSLAGAASARRPRSATSPSLAASPGHPPGRNSAIRAILRRILAFTPRLELLQHAGSGQPLLLHWRPARAILQVESQPSEPSCGVRIFATSPSLAAKGQPDHPPGRKSTIRAILRRIFTASPSLAASPDHPSGSIETGESQPSEPPCGKYWHFILGRSCSLMQAQVSHFSFTGDQPGPSSR